MACVTWLLSNMEHFVPLQQSKMQIAFATKSIVEERFGGQTFLGQQLLLIKNRAAHRENSRQEQEAAMGSHPVPTRLLYLQLQTQAPTMVGLHSCVTASQRQWLKMSHTLEHVINNFAS